MLSLTRIAASRASLIVPKAAVSSGMATRFFGMTSDLKKKVCHQRVEKGTTQLYSVEASSPDDRQ